MGKSLQHCQILNPCSPNLQKGKIYGKSLVSVLIYKTFETFMEALKYTLFEVTITFLYQFLFLKI